MYHYFEHEGLLFRGTHPAWADEVLTREGWAKQSYDCIKPVLEGIKLTEEEARTLEARKLAKRTA